MEKREEQQLIIAEYLSGGTSTRKLGIKYGYGHVTIARWIMAHKKYGRQPQQAVSGDALKAGECTAEEIATLREALRLSRLKIDLLEAMIDISDEQFGTDIRKKAGTRQS